MYTGTMDTGTLYTGTMINDLMAAVERAEQHARQQAAAEAVELRMLTSMYTQPMQIEPAFAGAA